MRIRGLEMLVFRKILCMYLMDGPLIILIKFILPDLLCSKSEKFRKLESSAVHVEIQHVFRNSKIVKRPSPSSVQHCDLLFVISG